MNRPLRFLVLLLAVSCSKAPPPASPVRAPLKTCILLTADLHGRVDRLPSIASLVQAERSRLRAAGFNVIHVDAGDFFQGTPEGDLTRGRVVRDAYNELGVEALVPGNHDFDLGPAVTEELARGARFPFLAANLKAAAWTRPSLVRRDLGIEILGLAPDSMERLSSRRARDGLSFAEAGPVLAAHAWTTGLARIVVTHLGLERDRALPLDGIAAVLGGHTHVRRVERHPGGAILLHPGSHGLGMGRLELELDPATGKVRAARADVIDVPDDRNEEIERLVEEHASEIRRLMSERVGRLTRDLPRGGPDFDGRSSPLGNHVADLAMEAANADAAILLRSSIRASLFAGSVRRRDLYEATPFPDVVVAAAVSGERLLRGLERALADDERLLIEVAGMSVTYDRGLPRGRRVRRVLVEGSELDPRREYRIATLELMIEPGGLLAGASSAEPTSRTLFDLQVAFLRERRRYTPPDFRSRIEPGR